MAGAPEPGCCCCAFWGVVGEAHGGTPEVVLALADGPPHGVPGADGPPEALVFMFTSKDVVLPTVTVAVERKKTCE